MHFSETNGGVTNPTELASMLICEEDSFEDGIRNAQEAIRDSCSMLLLTEKGLYAARDKMQICSFLWIHYGYPASEYEGINVELMRNRCGSALAKKDKVEIDFVAGIPDSGVGHALGYAN